VLHIHAHCTRAEEITVARRRNSLVEDIFDMLQQLPWWGGVIFADVFWFIGQIFAARTGTGPMDAAFRPFLK
jgi:hypothetical protein